MRIVLVEDNVALRKGLSYRLSDEGHAVDAFGDGAAADAHLAGERCDLVILDVGLPGLPGLEVLARMRARGDPAPVIVLTARGEVADRVAGLDAGADDYLTKPFEMDELAARIRALSRRAAAPPRPALSLGPLSLALSPLELTGPDGPMEVPRRELALLAALARAEGRLLSKDQLLDAVYGTGSDTEAQVIEVYVSRLRKRLAPHGLSIRARRGLGYMLGAP